jgi:hypothetical protein
VNERNCKGSNFILLILYNVRPCYRSSRLCRTEWRIEGGWTERNRVSWKALVACSYWDKQWIPSIILNVALTEFWTYNSAYTSQDTLRLISCVWSVVLCNVDCRKSVICRNLCGAELMLSGCCSEPSNQQNAYVELTVDRGYIASLLQPYIRWFTADWQVVLIYRAMVLAYWNMASHWSNKCGSRQQASNALCMVVCSQRKRLTLTRDSLNK